MNLIFIGDDFYSNSSTEMSSIYTTDGKRFNWGKVTIALRNGEEVHIRPATKEDLNIYYIRLIEILKRRKGRGQ